VDWQEYDVLSDVDVDEDVNDIMPGEDENGDMDIDMKEEGVIGLLTDERPPQWGDDCFMDFKFLAFHDEEQTWPFRHNMDRSMDLWLDPRDVQATVDGGEGVLNRTRWNMFLMGVMSGVFVHRYATPENVIENINRLEVSPVAAFGAHLLFDINLLGVIRSFLGNCSIMFGMTVTDETLDNFQEIKRTSDYACGEYWENNPRKNY